MDVVNIFPTDTKVEGAYVSAEEMLPDDKNLIVGIRVERCTDKALETWDKADSTMNLQLEISFDDGKTWVDGGGAECNGGVHVRRDGTDAPYSEYATEIPNGEKRKARARVTVGGRSIKTAISIFYGVH
jgi:hypothetical protein